MSRLQTYDITVNANALRSMKVRARSAHEAQEIAAQRIKDTAGAWTIDFPGGSDEHWSVWAGDEYMGPDAQGNFEDEDAEEDEED